MTVLGSIFKFDKTTLNHIAQTSEAAEKSMHKAMTYSASMAGVSMIGIIGTIIVPQVQDLTLYAGLGFVASAGTTFVLGIGSSIAGAISDVANNYSNDYSKKQLKNKIKAFREPQNSSNHQTIKPTL